eukprot:Skav222222  [mRNA]  locus=scaffold552:460252:462355:+ [translate_table: standard]
MPDPTVLTPPSFVQYVYTDGSCVDPAHPGERWAAFSIVCLNVNLGDLVYESEHKCEQLLQESFMTLALGHVKGKQTINRAELQAAVLAHELEADLEVVTDSDYVLKTHRRLRTHPDLSRLHGVSNFDLLQRWHTLIWGKGLHTPTTKIRSHQLHVSNAQDPFLHRLGNEAADRVAKFAVNNLFQPYLQQLRKRQQEVQAARTFLESEFFLRTSLSQMWAQLLQQEEVSDSWNPVQDATDFTVLRIEQPLHFAISDDKWEAVHVSRYGTHFSELVLKWLLSLKWPSEADTRQPPVGISLFELTVNFLLTTQQGIPIQVDGEMIDADLHTAWCEPWLAPERPEPPRRAPPTPKGRPIGSLPFPGLRQAASAELRRNRWWNCG